jgi:hypothetical protein
MCLPEKLTHWPLNKNILKSKKENQGYTFWGVCFDFEIKVRSKLNLNSLRDTAMQLRSQRPLHVQGDAGHPG